MSKGVGRKVPELVEGPGAGVTVSSESVSMFRSFDKLRTPQAQHIAGATNLGWTLIPSEVDAEFAIC